MSLGEGLKVEWFSVSPHSPLPPPPFLSKESWTGEFPLVRFTPPQRVRGPFALSTLSPEKNLLGVTSVFNSPRLPSAPLAKGLGGAAILERAAARSGMRQPLEGFPKRKLGLLMLLLLPLVLPLVLLLLLLTTTVPAVRGVSVVVGVVIVVVLLLPPGTLLLPLILISLG